jgi:hypothetical protein
MRKLEVEEVETPPWSISPHQLINMAEVGYKGPMKRTNFTCLELLLVKIKSFVTLQK